MAKDDRPRQRPYFVVMADYRVVFLKGLLQGPLSCERGIVHQPIQQLGSVPRRMLGKGAHGLKREVDDDPGSAGMPPRPPRARRFVNIRIMHTPPSYSYPDQHAERC